MLQTKTSYNV